MAHVRGVASISAPRRAASKHGALTPGRAHRLQLLAADGEITKNAGSDLDHNWPSVRRDFDWARRHSIRARRLRGHFGDRPQFPDLPPTLMSNLTMGILRDFHGRRIRSGEILRAIVVEVE